MAGKPAAAGKKLVATVSKPSSTTPAVTFKTPSQGGLEKAAGASNGEKTKAEEGKPNGKGKGSAEKAAEKAPKAPRAKNAYMFFMTEKRDAVKGKRLVHSCCDMLVRACMSRA